MATTNHLMSADPADVDAITAVAHAYLETYVSGDSEGHLRVYHPEAVKRRFTVGDDGMHGLIVLSPQIMADSAPQQDVDGDCPVEIVVDDVFEDIASVRVYSCQWVDFLHVVKARDEWRLFHVTWQRREP